MSTKKDKFNHKDRYFMNLAINLASERSGLTGENPSVGCVIVKKNGRKSSFDRDKLSKSVYIALKKRPIDTEPVEKFISKISRSLEEQWQAEISTSIIGTMVMEGLKELDPVAYVRFASVYRNFREEKDFVQFVDRLDVYKKR